MKRELATIALLVAASAAGFIYSGSELVKRAGSRHEQSLRRIEAARITRAAERESLRPVCERYFEYTKLPGWERVPSMERSCGFMWEEGDDK